MLSGYVMCYISVAHMHLLYPACLVFGFFSCRRLSALLPGILACRARFRFALHVSFFVLVDVTRFCSILCWLFGVHIDVTPLCSHYWIDPERPLYYLCGAPSLIHKTRSSSFYKCATLMWCKLSLVFSK